MRYKITFKRTMQPSQQNFLNRIIYKELDKITNLKYRAEPGPEKEVQLTFKSEEDYTFFCLQWNTDKIDYLEFIPIGAVKN